MYSHPKLEKLEEVVLQHFRQWDESSADNTGDLLIIAVQLIYDSYIYSDCSVIELKYNSHDLHTAKRQHWVFC